MSMLSAQVDELRNLATKYDELQVGAVKAVTMPSNMGSILREAADTIWELRESVHRERNEADRLREQADFEHFQLGEMKRAAGMMLDEFVALKNGNARLATEYAKLRKLVASYESALHRLCDQTLGYVHCHDCILGKDYGDDSCAIDELREAAANRVLSDSLTPEVVQQHYIDALVTISENGNLVVVPEGSQPIVQTKDDE